MRNNLWIGSGISRMGGIPMLGTGARGLTTLIKGIFRNNEQGFAYDPNDLTTLYQDAVGTIPVTAAGQPVGLMLDKSKGLVLGGELLLNNSFDTDSNWIKGTGWTISNGAAYFDGSIIFSSLTQNIVLDGNALYKVEIDFTGGNTPLPDIRLLFNNILKTQTPSKNGKLIAYIQSENNEPITTFSIQSRGTTGADAMREVSNVSLKKVSGNHAYQTVSASRPILQRNATTGAYYLAFDGVDDFLQTNSIDFTSTDEVSLFAGVRKLSDAASYSVVYELSNDAEKVGGAFMMMTPHLASNKGIFFTSMGTELNYAHITNFPAPINLLTTMQASIGTPLLKARVNGVQVSNSLASQGTGNYGNYPLYIGRRGGTSLPFNGHLYSLVGIGRLTTDSETIALEKSIAKNVGVTLNA